MGEIDSKGNQYTNGFECLLLVHKGATSIEIPNQVKQIFGKERSDYAFISCSDTIKSFTFSSGSLLETIQPYSFYNCNKLSSVDLSQCTHLTKIDEFAFNKCSAVETLLFPPSLEFIGVSSFKDCSVLKEVEFPRSIKTISFEAFYFCYSLVKVTFQEGCQLTELESRSFGGASILEFNVPENCQKATGTAFEGSNTMERITAVNNPYFEVINGALCYKNRSAVVYFPPSYTTGEYTMPDVEAVSSEAFFSCKASEIKLPLTLKWIYGYSFYGSWITKLSIPDNVIYIEPFAFCLCSNLTSVKLSNQVTNIPESLFQDCSSLVEVEIPNTVEIIGPSCFSGCKSLENVFIPKSVKSFDGAFSDCPKINITIEEGSSMKIDSQSIIYSNNGQDITQFLGYKDDTEIEIPTGVKKIKTAAFLSKSNILSVSFINDNELNYIENRAFKSCRNLRTFSFPKTLISIGEEAFMDCENLLEVHLYSKLTFINKCAFKNCYRLETIIFEDTEGILNIAEEVFFNSFGLKTLTLGEGIATIGNFFTRDSTGLKEVILPSTLTSVGEEAFRNSGITRISFRGATRMKNISSRAFYEVKQLNYFQFSEGIEIIGPEAFSYTNLTEIVLPKSVKKLGSRCFQYCKSVTLFKQPEQGSLEEIGLGVFENCEKFKTVECNNIHFKTSNNALFDSEMASLFVVPPASDSMFFCIPNQVRIIGPSAFYGCKKILTITIPDDSVLETVGPNAFSQCSSLRTINIPFSVKNIYADAFLGCSDLLCGQCILNQTEAFRENLIQNAKMPKRCLNKCVYNLTMNCRFHQFSQILFVLSIFMI